VNSTEHSAKQPFAETARSVRLSALLRAKENSAPALRRIAFLAVATTALLALTAVPVLAARGHVFSSEFASEGSGLGQLKDPFGVAVNESTRDVYVADFGNSRVERFSFNTGTQKYEFASQIVATTGAGAGNLTEGSQRIETVSTSSGAFVPGQTIIGSGIPAETKITAVEESGHKLTISHPVEAGGTATGVSLSASQPLLEPHALAVDNHPASPSHGDLYLSVGVAPAVVDKFSTSGEFLGQITHLPPTTGTGDLEAGSNVITSFAAPSGHFQEGDTITGAGIPPATKITGCGLNGEFNGGGCLRTGASNEIKLSNPVEAGATASGVALTAEAGPFEVVRGVAVDPSGALFVLAPGIFGTLDTFDRFDSASANEFQHACVQTETEPPGLAVDSRDNFYVDNGREPGVVEEFDSNCRLLNKNLGAEAPDAALGVTRSGIAVEASTDNPYIDNIGSIGRFTSAGAELERFGAGHLAAEECNELEHGLASCLGGLAVSSASGEVFAAVGTPARIAVFGLEPPAAPRIENESVSAVTDDSAKLEAELNPRGLSGEAPTGYHFEYGPCVGALATCPASPYASTTPPGSLPPSFEVESLSISLESLQAQTTYHFRLVTENARGSAQGAERTVTTFSAGEFTLPDGRAWEMVSASDLRGTVIEPLNMMFTEGAPVQTAAGGGAFTFGTITPTEAEAPGNADANQVFSARSASGGWSSHDIALPHSAPTTTSLGEGDEARVFSEDLTRAAFQPFGPFTPLSPAASEPTAYLNDTTSGAFTPLVTGCPAERECPAAVEAAADVPPGTVFGKEIEEGTGTCPPVIHCGPEFVGASADLGHVIVQSKVALTTTPLPAKAVGLYEWSVAAPPAERLQLVSLLPPAGPGAEENPATRPVLGFEAPGEDTRGAVSADGARVFFTNGVHLYMRDTTAQRTLELDLPEAGCACGAGSEEAIFQLASSDGSRVFFTDERRLTAGSRAANAKPDLYECRIAAGPGGAPECQLADLTPANGAEAGHVIPSVPGASADGAYVYFVADGVLAPGASPGNCVNGDGDRPVATHTCNLYLRHAGATTYIAALSARDNPDWGKGIPVPSHLTARVSPGGHWFAFMSRRSLTGYDNRDAASGVPDEEVYLYEADHARLTCASCNPTGARPHGVEYSESSLPLSAGSKVWDKGEDWLAANIPGWTRFRLSAAAHQPRYLSDSGRLFFNSTDGLVAKDANGVGDVYQFEPEGQGNCASNSTNGGVTYRPARPFEVEFAGLARSGEEAAGCVGLISPGISSEESALLDASESGDDVFFLSTSKLSPLDVEGGRTVYDAHVCTGASPCPPPPPPPKPVCAGDACQQPVAAPNDATPGSLTFQGPGNILAEFKPPPPIKKTAAQIRAEKLAKALKACNRDKNKRKRSSCRKAAHKKYGSAATKKGKR
jgi:hypothetical protein